MEYTREQIIEALKQFDEGYTGYDRPSHDREYTTEELLERLEETAKELDEDVDNLIYWANEEGI